MPVIGYQKRCRVGLPVLDLLQRLSDPVGRDEVIAGYPSERHRAVSAAIDTLVSHGFVDEVTDSASSATATAPDWWEAWGISAKQFHYTSRDVNFVSFRTERSHELAAELSGERDLPPISKNYPGAPTLPLPRTFRSLDVSLATALLSRRTNRDFTTKAVSIDDFATLLHYTFAPLRFQDTGVFGTQMVKASPAGGSRHDIECYVYPRNVEDIPPGLYHYNNMNHALEFLRSDIDDDQVRSILGDQDYCVQAGFICFLTSVTDRISFKYRHPRAYRTWMYNVGHAAQTFALAATGLRLGPYQTAAFKDSELEDLLGVDSDVEFCTYVIGAGVPVLRMGNQPHDYRPAKIS